MKLTRTDWKYLIDSLMLICILGMAVIGFLLRLVIPRGTAAEDSKYFLGLHRHQWGDIHFGLSMAFIILLCIHLVLEWNWIKGKARQLFKRFWKVALMVTLLAAFLVPFLFRLLASKDDPNYREQRRRGSQDGIGAATSSDFSPRSMGPCRGLRILRLAGG